MECDGIILKADGSLVRSSWVYDEEKDIGEYIQVPLETIIKNFMTSKEFQNFDFPTMSHKVIFDCLWRSVYLEEDVTLRSYFKMVEKYPCLQDLSLYFSSFLEEYHNCPESGCTHEPNKKQDVEFLEVYRFVNYQTYDDSWAEKFEVEETSEEDKKKGFSNINEPGGIFHKQAQEILKQKEEGTWEQIPDEIECYYDFHGIGFELTEDSEGFKKGERTPWAIEYSPLSHHLDLPLKIGNTMMCWEDSTKEGREKYQKLEAGGDNPSLYDFVNSIIWELSFCGTPSDREEKNKELKDSLDEVRENLEEKDVQSK